MSARGWALLAWALAAISTVIWYSHVLFATGRPTPAQPVAGPGTSVPNPQVLASPASVGGVAVVARPMAWRGC